LNLQEEDNLSTKDTTAEFILFLKCPLFRGSNVFMRTVPLSFPAFCMAWFTIFRHSSSSKWLLQRILYPVMMSLFSSFWSETWSY